MIELDDINRDLIDLLTEDGRMSYRELGERVGLTAPAVTERIRKLEELGVKFRTMTRITKLLVPPLPPAPDGPAIEEAPSA